MARRRKKSDKKWELVVKPGDRIFVSRTAVIPSKKLSRRGVQGVRGDREYIPKMFGDVLPHASRNIIENYYRLENGRYRELRKRRNRARQYSREIFDELVKHLGLGKRDLRGRRIVRYLWRKSREIARHQVDLEMMGGILVPRINSVSLWLVDDHVWKPATPTKISIDGFENIFFTSVAINTHRGWVHIDLEPSKEFYKLLARGFKPTSHAKIKPDRRNRRVIFHLSLEKEVEIYRPENIVKPVDVNERIVYGDHVINKESDTDIDRGYRWKKLAEDLQKRYSFPRYPAWRRRRGILNSIRSYHRKSRNILEDWARKTSLEIVRFAMRLGYAVAREDLGGLIESPRKLPKDHGKKLIIMGYKRIGKWIDWQVEKRGVQIAIVKPNGISSKCSKCDSKGLEETGYRRLGYPRCRFEGDRDVIGKLNIRKRAQKILGISWGSLVTLSTPQMIDANPNRWGNV